MAADGAAAPRILDVSWGRMEVEGHGVGKDFVLYPGGGEAWDWGVTGMSHDPGVRPVDVAAVLAHAPSVVVLSHGMEGRLQVDPATLDLLAERGIEVVQGLTPEVVARYNALVDAGERVAGLFHSTC
jgi:hypothetical protein